MTIETNPSTPPDVSDAEVMVTRGYQQEMLDASLKRNTILAMDTGSGKTHIAVLRIKIEVEREAKKVSWFLAPTVTLCKQQHGVISTAIPVSVGLISGALEPEQWKDRALWERVLETHRIVVSTPQVLLDALRHGYINMGRDTSLIVFDEVHHAVDHHPYADIMSEFYMHLPTKATPALARPMILGLTASPIYGGNVELKFRQLERNMDSVIRAPETHREELEQHVHRPSFQHTIYKGPDWFNLPVSVNHAALKFAISQLNIEDDPYVIQLRRHLSELPPGPQRLKKDQTLSKVIKSGKTYTHKGLKDFERAANEICVDLGTWAADWYVEKVLSIAKAAAEPYENIISGWQDKEKAYLLGILASITVNPVSFDGEAMCAGASDKFLALVATLLAEKDKTEALNDSYSGLVFVTRRDAVLALSEMLARYPDTANVFSVGSLLGNAESSYRQSFLDITRKFLTRTAEETLSDFRIGEKNLIVATSVAEEGIDIQACGSVIGWDLPANMVSFAQRRGRARQKRSTFVLMFEDATIDEGDFKAWERMENEMVQAYRDRQGDLAAQHAPEPVVDDSYEDGLQIRVDSTGALMTLQSVIPHLMHFCAVLPNTGSVEHRPLFEIEPPEFVEGWHTLPPAARSAVPYLGPFGCKVTLPMLLVPELREFSVEMKYSNKVSAFRHAAFKAYDALHKAGLLNEHLLPLSSVMEAETEEEVQKLLKDVEARAGTAAVTGQMDPWQTSTPHALNWWLTRLSAEGLPTYELITRAKPLTHAGDAGPTLYHPDHGIWNFQMTVVGEVEYSDVTLEEARTFTRAIFWTVHGSRMVWENNDFVYMFLPGPVEPLWSSRRQWMTSRDVPVDPSFPNSVDAAAFGDWFSFPKDLTVVRQKGRAGKPYRFIRWRFENLTTEEVDEIRETHKHFPETEICYPLLVVQLLHPRQNFLDPSLPVTVAAAPVKEVLLLANLSTIDMLSPSEVELALIAPSILQSIARSTTLNSLRENLLGANPRLASIPSSLLATAITSGAAGDITNYQRLETLGDTVLKLTTSLQLLGEFPLWHEGYLAKRKDHAVSNVRLAKDAVKRELYRWIIRDRFVAKKWRPRLQTKVVDGSPPEEQRLSTKVLADVLEALIGAAYVHGGFSLAIECIRFFGLGLSFGWKELPACVDLILHRVVPTSSTFPVQLTHAEKILGYTFQRKMLLVEALTHASHQLSQHTTISYERSEFLGDCVLDMVLTEILYNAPGKNYGPGQIHLRRSAMANAHYLAYVCMAASVTVDASMPRPSANHKIQIETDTHDVYLWQCLLHSSPQVLEDQSLSMARYQHVRKDIEIGLTSSIFPWAALTRIQAPKFFSDLVESLIGAVYLDSMGNWSVVRGVLKTLGVIPLLEHIIATDAEVYHPISRLHNWAQRGEEKKTVEYVFTKEKGRICCQIKIDDTEIARAEENHRGKASQEEVKLGAAEEALRNIGL